MTKSKTKFSTLSQEFNTSRILDLAGLGVASCLEEGIGAVVIIMGAKKGTREVVLTQTLDIFGDDRKADLKLLNETIENPNDPNWDVCSLEE